jgi:hypothetical protein
LGLPADRKLRQQQRQADKCDCCKVDNEKRRAAVVADNIREASDITEAYRGSKSRKNKTLCVAHWIRAWIDFAIAALLRTEIFA